MRGDADTSRADYTITKSLDQIQKYMEKCIRQFQFSSIYSTSQMPAYKKLHSNFVNNIHPGMSEALQIIIMCQEKIRKKHKRSTSIDIDEIQMLTDGSVSENEMAPDERWIVSMGNSCQIKDEVRAKIKHEVGAIIQGV